MTVDPARRVQALYVPVSDSVRLAVDVWLPGERIARGERVGTAFRATRYWRAEQPPGPEPAADSNRAVGELWNSAGFALVLADARGTGASFGSRTMELGPREIADYGELIDWVAAQPWSNGRVGLFGSSYEGQAAELTAALGNPHVTAVAALFSPVDPYRQLFYPGGCATGGRFAKWMCNSQVKDGVAGDRLAPEGQDRRLVEFFTRYVEHAERPDGQRRLNFGTLGTDQWQAVSSWPPDSACLRSWYLSSSGELASQAGPAAHLRHVVESAAATGPTNRWLAVDLGRGTAYPDRRHADEALLTFTSEPLPADLHLAGFPVITLRLATSGSDGAIYAYLEDVAPDGTATYLTEGCLRFLHRATNGPADPTRLGVPRTFARADQLAVEPGHDLDLTVQLGDHSTLGLPILAARRLPRLLR